MNAIEEARYASVVAAFALAHNRRCNKHVEKTQVWVRMTPPGQADFDTLKQDPRWLPFLRVGSLGEIVDVCDKYVTIQVGGDALMFEREMFFQTFVRAVAGTEWREFPSCLR